MPTFEVVDRPRDHVTDIDRFARLGIGHQTVVGVLVLEVEDSSKATCSAGELRMGRDIVDRLVAQPHFTLAIA
jgi:hypothetical protein